MWGLVVSLFGGGIKEWLAGRQKVAQIEAETKAKRAQSGIPGWSDEYLVIIVTYPLVAQFVPFLQDSAAAGMAAIAQMPGWYVGMVGSVVGAVFGIDKLLMFKGGAFK